MNLRLLGSLLIAATVLAANPAFADSNSSSVVGANDQRPIAVKKAAHKDCLVRISGQPFAQPCDRLAEMPSTAEPMQIIGILPRK